MSPLLLSRSDSLYFSRFADDFKTVNGKEYKNAKVTRVEPGGIVLMTNPESRRSISLNYQKKFKSAFTTIHSRLRRLKPPPSSKFKISTGKRQKSISSRKRHTANCNGSQANTQALADRLADLGQQEVNLLAAIGRAENAQTVARRKWADDQSNQQYTDPAEANFPLLRGRLENVRSEKRTRQTRAGASAASVIRDNFETDFLFNETAVKW